ncbi:MGH1-like glycoside hydrolase domain-containing protein [Lacihabitans soyangensis]|uniref:Glucosidase n=1 Tax=Lacihabitans soyangensis TaxID=869394 RepID=A0AAE3H130_9BACT|nr:glucosidase [Lacihabitans soyangensis]MCP9763054.1 glucosidase [Lacihabitans soyangensis]
MESNTERKRLIERADNKGWKKWGPYLSERQWGTVREDYSVYGDAWNYLTHDMARSRAYRWGEDGIGGISDNKQHICFALALWNHKDSILKERLFGLTNNEGNHGEDVKELYYYLDSTPTHSYMKMLYKYPIEAFPYEKITGENNRRNIREDEYEIIDTGVFDDNKYFDIFVEYAKREENDIFIKITATNRSKKEAPLTVLPTIWFRNTWSWGYEEFDKKPILSGIANSQIEVNHRLFERMKLYCHGADSLLFCENETNMERVFGKENASPYTKDGINNYIVHGKEKAINHNQIGTKASAKYTRKIKAGESETFWLRFSDQTNLKEPFVNFEEVFAESLKTADDFYEIIQKDIKSEEEKAIQRQAFAGMMWSKQFYYYNIDQWMNGDPKMPFEFRGRAFERNSPWKHAYMANILSMPDKWEYPWFAAWDLAFHTATLARIDPDFAKRQLAVVLREYYMHPNGQIPAYEWNFSDVNPPVHAWATWKVYETDKEMNGGKGDVGFLERIFHKLLLNFTWWVNQKDEDGNNIFGGGFLGLDNIGVFDRNAQIPGVKLQQADATGWMAIYTLNMLKIACEISLERPAYQDMASKFFEHFLYIAAAINKTLDEEGNGLWDEDDQFYYDKIYTPDANTLFLKIRSLVGLIPLCAVEVISEDLLQKLPDFKRRLEWILKNRPDLAGLISRWHEPGKGETHLLSLLRGHRMKMVFKRLFDEKEFLSDYGIRSMSKFHLENPYHFNLHGEHLNVKYTPGESDLTIMGGNSNWRGPVWFPLNYLIIDSLHKYSKYYGEDYEVEYPTNSGEIVTIREAALQISERLINIFKEGENGKKPFMGGVEKFNKDKDFKDYYHFYEYFHGDNGKGLGAAHQTGWTGLVADLIQEVNEGR